MKNTALKEDVPPKKVVPKKVAQKKVAGTITADTMSDNAKEVCTRLYNTINELLEKHGKPMPQGIRYPDAHGKPMESDEVEHYVQALNKPKGKQQKNFGQKIKHLFCGYLTQLVSPRKLPAFSVVTVCMNAEKHIEQAINSVNALEYKGQLEHHIQDGGSTDGTEAIVKKHAKNARFVSEPDKATLDGLIKAARQCTGEYIALCWADDELLPNALSWAAEIFEKTGADVIYGDQIMIDAESGEKKLITGAPWSLVGMFNNEFYPPSSSSFYRRDALLKIADYMHTFDHDEYECWCLLGATGVVRYYPGVVSRFHIHKDTRWVEGDDYVANMCEGKLAAVKRLVESGLFPDFLEEKASEAEMTIQLWAALHLLHHKGNMHAIEGYARKAIEHFNGDYRFYQLRDTLAEKLGKKIPAYSHST